MPKEKLDLFLEEIQLEQRIKSGGRVTEYKNLPEEAQKAILTFLEDNVDEVDPDKKFGYKVIDINEISDAIMNLEGSEIPEDFDTFEDYHAWYVKGGDMPDHTNFKYPVILGDFENEIIRDGWHRFHDYYRKGVKELHLVWFV